MKIRIVQLVLAVLISAPSFAQNLSFRTGAATPDEISTLPLRETIDGYDEYFEITYHFESAFLQTEKVADETYQFLNIEGFSNLQIPGSPALPAHNDLLAMPYGSKPEVRILEAEYFEYSGFNIHPALQPARDTEGAPEPDFYKDLSVYEKNAFFPESPVMLNASFLFRGIPIAKVQTSPILFNPVSGIVRVYTKIRYELIYHAQGATLSDIVQKNSSAFTHQLKQLVLNHKAIPDGINNQHMVRENGSCNYIIITHEAYLGAAQHLAEWKKQLGFAVEIVSKNSWNSATVKEEIQTRYDMWSPHPDYFVIIGDHAGQFAVPGNIKQDPFYGNNYASDLDYACMDGDNDWHPDMAHGRISASTPSEAENIIDKIVNYEQEPPDSPNFYQNVLTCAQYQDDDNNGYADRRFLHTSEDINGYLTGSQGYNAERIYYTSSSASKDNLRYNAGYYSMGELLPAELRTTGFNWSGGSSEITSSINNGKLIVFHRDHGYVGGSGWAHPYYTIYSMDNLANGTMQPVVFSINCHTGEFQLDNCFAEKLLRLENKGAVGVVAAAYYSFSGYNDAFSIGMIDAIWPNPGLYANFGSGGTGSNSTIGSTEHFLTMGEVLNQGLYAMETNWNGSSTSKRYQFNLFHWFGDPAMRLWTENPNDNPISATHADELYCDQNTFIVENCVPEALVTLLLDETLIAIAETDETGFALLEYEISSPGEGIALTISKHNHLTYEAEIALTGVCDYPPLVTTGTVQGQTAGTAAISGTIDDNFGSVVTASGMLFSTSTNLEFGEPGVYNVSTDPVVSNGSFMVNLTELEPDEVYYFKAYAENEFGIGYGDVAYFISFPPVISIPYMQDFENGGDWPSEWETDNANVWDLRTNWHGASDPGGYHVYSDYSPSETGTVYSPIFDGTEHENLHVSFYHYWQADYPGYTQDAYFYGSIDGGATWPYLIDEWHHDDPPYEEGENLYDISTWADGQQSISFKWEVTHNNDWYWEFDDFKLEPFVEPGTWFGTNSNDWNDPGNWSGNVLPNALTNVIIPGNPEGDYFPETNSGDEAICNNMIIHTGAHLYIPSEGALTVYGDLLNLSGVEGLILKSAAPGVTGSLIHHNRNVEASIACYLTQLKWHFIGSPVEEAETGVFYLPGNSLVYLNAFITGENFWGPFIGSTTEPLVQGKGYECWVSDNVDQDETIVFTGSLNSGDYTTGMDMFVDLEYENGNGLNLIANPYPSAIVADIDNWNRKSVATTVWTWNEEDGNYVYWNGDNGVNEEGWGTLTNGIIPAMQGFFVQATGSSPLLTIPQSSRVHSSIGFYKNNQPLPNTLKISADANGYHDEILIQFNSSAQNGYEPERDVRKLYGLDDAPQLYAVCENENLSINVMDHIIQGKQVALGFYTGSTSDFNFNLEGVDQFDPSVPIYLADIKTGDVYNLKKTDHLSFNYNPGDDKNRFMICFGEDAIPDFNAISKIEIFAYDHSITIRSSAHENTRVQVYDLLGKSVFEKFYLSNGSEIIDSGLPAGIYIVKVQNNSQSQFKKVQLR